MPKGSDDAEEAALTRSEQMATVFDACYREAEGIVSGERPNDLPKRLGGTETVFSALGELKHSARGVALTLCAYKVVDMSQDIRAHKSEQPGGFSARSFDSDVTVPFLISKTLPRSVESHWLSQTFSFAGPYTRGSLLKTQPTKAGPLLIEAVNLVQEANTEDFARAAVTAILEQLIRIRNQERVVLTRPKDLSIEKVTGLIESHINRRYRTSGPRLPQLVIYAVYQCMMHSVGRFGGLTLERLERMKSADRKSGVVGDVVLTKDGAPIEAIEIKHQAISFIHVAEAIDKVRALAVRRYYILSTVGVDPDAIGRIEASKSAFSQQNGCEIIINGVIHSLSYYLRLLPSTTEFVFAYATLLETDEDVGYEHRVAWNECCQMI